VVYWPRTGDRQLVTEIFRSSTLVVDVGGGCDDEGVILTPQPSPTVAMEVGRMVLKFDGD
jgi:hypothetical protein